MAKILNKTLKTKKMNSKTLEAVMIAAAATMTGMILYDIVAPKIKSMLHISTFEEDLV